MYYNIKIVTMCNLTINSFAHENIISIIYKMNLPISYRCILYIILFSHFVKNIHFVCHNRMKSYCVTDFYGPLNFNE